MAMVLRIVAVFSVVALMGGCPHYLECSPDDSAAEKSCSDDPKPPASDENPDAGGDDPKPASDTVPNATGDDTMGGDVDSGPARDAGHAGDLAPAGENRDAKDPPSNGGAPGTSSLPDAGGHAPAMDAPTQPIPNAAPPAEPCASVIWYRDCDGDGFAAGTGGNVSACTIPRVTTNCATWTPVAPQPGKVDCNDNNPQYHPGADFGVAGSGDGDRDCNGIVEMAAKIARAPAVVDQHPSRVLGFCFDRGVPAWVVACQCFLGTEESKVGIPPIEPSCARSTTDTVQAFWMHFSTPSDPTSPCTYAVTFSLPNAQVDFYDVLQTCR